MKKNNSGMITLEACISVLSFLMLMLFISGLFVVFMAQNLTAHVTLQTAQSLSLDAYSNEKITHSIENMDDADSLGKLIEAFVIRFFGEGGENKEYFVTTDDWYNDPAKIEEVVKKRFTGYLSGGDENRANSILSMLNVKGDLGDLDFSGSHVKDGTLYVVLSYELEYDFNIGDLGTIKVTQTACAKLWK